MITQPPGALTPVGSRPGVPLLSRLTVHLTASAYNSRSPYFGKLAFTYDPAHEAYTCPQGHTLHYWSINRHAQLFRYRADAGTCAACPLKARCTPSIQGREVSRSYDEAYVDRVRAYQATAPYRKAIRKRSVWVEPLFAEAKQWHGLRRFRWRRLWRVNAETLVIASGQNLKRLLSQQGWGRRPFPGGAPGVRIGVAVAPHLPAVLPRPADRSLADRCTLRNGPAAQAIRLFFTGLRAYPPSSVHA